MTNSKFSGLKEYVSGKVLKFPVIIMLYQVGGSVFEEMRLVSLV